MLITACKHILFVPVYSKDLAATALEGVY